VVDMEVPIIIYDKKLTTLSYIALNHQISSARMNKNQLSIYCSGSSHG